MTRSTCRLREPDGARNGADLFAAGVERGAEQGGGPHGAQRLDLLSQLVVRLAGEWGLYGGFGAISLMGFDRLSFSQICGRAMTWLRLPSPCQSIVRCSIAVLSSDVDYPLLAPSGAMAVPRPRKGVRRNGSSCWRPARRD